MINRFVSTQIFLSIQDVFFKNSSEKLQVFSFVHVDVVDIADRLSLCNLCESFIQVVWLNYLMVRSILPWNEINMPFII